jgi:hypothetical protein
MSVQGIQGPEGPIAGSANQIIYKNSNNEPVGSNELVFTSDNRLGIGTTSPTEKLDVNGNAIISGTILASNLNISN